MCSPLIPLPTTTSLRAKLRNVYRSTEPEQHTSPSGNYLFIRHYQPNKSTSKNRSSIHGESSRSSSSQHAEPHHGRPRDPVPRSRIWPRHGRDRRGGSAVVGMHVYRPVSGSIREDVWLGRDLWGRMESERDVEDSGDGRERVHRVTKSRRFLPSFKKKTKEMSGKRGQKDRRRSADPRRDGRSSYQGGCTETEPETEPIMSGAVPVPSDPRTPSMSPPPFLRTFYGQPGMSNEESTSFVFGPQGVDPRSSTIRPVQKSPEAGPSGPFAPQNYDIDPWDSSPIKAGLSSKAQGKRPIEQPTWIKKPRPPAKSRGGQTVEVSTIFDDAGDDDDVEAEEGQWEELGSEKEVDVDLRSIRSNLS